MVKVNRALFPLSGDPITNGHLNIIERASKWVQELVVVVLDNDVKDSVLTLKERVAVIRLCLESRHLDNVKVDAYDGLLSDYATHSGIFHIIRGIRNANDLEYEIYLEFGHKRQNPRLEIIYFLSEPQHRTTSSSIARSILKRGGQIQDYVPLQAKQAMEEKLMGQYKLIVTGGIACGKSFITAQLMDALAKKGYSVHNIDFDLLVKAIYRSLSRGEYPNLSSEIVDFFGQVVLEDGRVSQRNVSRAVFSPTDPHNQNIDIGEKLQNLLGMLRPYINSLYHQEVAAKKGLIFLNIPIAAESQMLYESNNNILLIRSQVETQKKRLIEDRGIDEKEALLRIQRAGSSEEKQQRIEEILERDRVGKLILYDNEKEGALSHKIADLQEKVLELFLHPIKP